MFTFGRIAKPVVLDLLQRQRADGEECKLMRGLVADKDSSITT